MKCLRRVQDVIVRQNREIRNRYGKRRSYIEIVYKNILKWFLHIKGWMKAETQKGGLSEG